MALIKCKGCGHEVSNKAFVCPQCGCSVQQDKTPQAVEETVVDTQNAKNGKRKIFAWVALILFLIIGGGSLALTKHSNEGKKDAISIGGVLNSLKESIQEESDNAIVELSPDFIEAIRKYGELDVFSDGMAAVQRNGKWGYINIKGEEVIPCKYDKAEIFFEGLAAVQRNSKWGYINKKGKEIIPISIEAYYANNFVDDLAVVINDDYQFSVIDRKGDIAFSGKCDFSQFGEAMDEYMHRTYTQEKLYIPIPSAKYAIYNKDGKNIGETRIEIADESKTQKKNSNLYTIFAKENGGGKYYQWNTVGLMDSNDNIVVPAIYDGIENTGLGEQIEINNGVVLVKLEEYIGEVYEGLGGVLESENTKYYYGYADLKGNNTFSENVIKKCKESKEQASIQFGQREMESLGSMDEFAHNDDAFSFNSNRDYDNYFSSPKKYKGRLAFSESGVVEIKKEDDVVNVYVNGHHLSALGFTHKNQKYLFGDYVRMFVYCDGRTYPVVIHLPDKEHPYEYFYFDPMQTSTDERLVMVMGIPKTEGWLWVEPTIQEGKATLIWHTDATSRPSPQIFRLIE